jgi:flagellar basal-body rod protein FlgB
MMDMLFSDMEKISIKANYFMERTKIIQSNIANADTPLYKPKELVFQTILQENIKLKTTNEKHISPEGKETYEIKVMEDGYVHGYDGNKVNLEHELAKLAESSIMYKTLMELMKKESAKLSYVITGR